MTMKSGFVNGLFDELSRARKAHAPIHSLHEALGVLLEEMDEFQREVFKRPSARDPEAIYDELIDIAATALRTALDLELGQAARAARRARRMAEDDQDAAAFAGLIPVIDIPDLAYDERWPEDE